MHIYNSNHYSSTIKQIINDCLHSAKENPFAIHYVIVDDPKYYEEIFLKHTDTIFNIELMTLSSFYQKLLQIYHQDFRKKTDIQNLLEIIKMNKEDTSSLFHLSANHVLTAKQILDIFKNFYLYNIQETTKELPNLSKEKIKTLFNLYHQFLKIKHLFKSLINMVMFLFIKIQKKMKFLIIQVTSQIIYLIHHIQKVTLNILIKS